MRKLRLIKVAVQPYFVIDDGENIEEISHPVTIIPANEWVTYSSKRFPCEVEEWQRKLDNDTITIQSDFGRPNPKDVVYDNMPRDSKGNYGTAEGKNITIIKNLDEII